MSANTSRVSLGLSDAKPIDASIDEAGNLVIPASALPFEPGGPVRVVVGGARGPSHRADATGAVRGLIAVVVAAALLGGAVAVFAANGRHWHWTGFAGRTSLWSWLQLLVQPAVLAFLTVHLLGSVRVWRAWRIAGRAAGLLLLLVVVAGYSWHWAWTGFRHKELWDWLNLLLFPVVLVLLPEWVKRGEPFGARARVIALLVALAFALLVLGGYRWGWTWTGFTGNSFRNWLALMIAPFLLPTSLKVVHAVHTARQHTAHALPRPELVVQLA